MEPSEFELRRRAALEAHERQRAEYASIGWREIINEEEVRALFDRLVTTFFPAHELCVPAPSITWDVARATHLPAYSSEQLFLVDDLHRKCLPALKRSSLHSAPWFVLENYNHPCYRLHFDEMPEHIEDWPVELLPFRDPCYLLAPDFKSGIIATLHESITVFGEQLLLAINKNLPLAFTHIVCSNLPDGDV